MKRDELVRYLDQYLGISSIRDYGPQGLQVEGRDEVHRIVGTVDAHVPCIEAARSAGADMLLVHHGIFWGEAKPARGALGSQLRALFAAEMNLYAAHLALDAHSEVGNNVELARRAGLDVIGTWGSFNGVDIGVLAQPKGDLAFSTMVERFRQRVGEPVLVQAHGPESIRRVAILSGGGAGEIEEAVRLDCDTVLTGETSHAHYYDALESRINVIYGGHYTTEIVGVQALGAHIAERWGVEFTFIDLPTGI